MRWSRNGRVTRRDGAHPTEQEGKGREKDGKVSELEEKLTKCVCGLHSLPHLRSTRDLLSPENKVKSSRPWGGVVLRPLLQPSRRARSYSPGFLILTTEHGK